MAEDTTRRIRSSELRERARQNEERFRSSEDQIERTRERVRMTTLALRARSPQQPPERSPGDTYVRYAPALPGPDAERRGNVVAGLTTARSRLFENEELVGEGEIELLRNGRVWARTSSNRYETFEARIQPPRLAEYNELLIPHIAGTINLDVFGPDDTYSVREIETSRLMRFDRPQRFNGRIRLESRSQSTTPDGEYIHTLGGLSFFESSWGTSAEIRCDVNAPAGGQISDIQASLRPTGHSPSFDVYVGGSKQALPLSVQEGDRIEIRFTGVPGTVGATMCKVSLSY